MPRISIKSRASTPKKKHEQHVCCLPLHLVACVRWTTRYKIRGWDRPKANPEGRRSEAFEIFHPEKDYPGL
jgi:hypothetical protein